MLKKKYSSFKIVRGVLFRKVHDKNETIRQVDKRNRSSWTANLQWNRTLILLRESAF